MSVKPNFGGKDLPLVFKGDQLIYPNYVKDGLALHYDFSGMTNQDVNKDIAYDLSGNGNHGTLQNFNYTAESGYDENKLLFDGVDDFISTSQTLSDFTILFSIEVSGTDEQFFFGGDVNSFYLRKYLGDRLHGSYHTDSQGTISQRGVFKNTGEIEKHSVGLILDSQRLKVGLIHNGTIVTENSLGAEPSLFTLQTLGQWGSDSRRLSGSLMSTKIYNRALTPEEIAHNYAIEKERFSIE